MRVSRGTCPRARPRAVSVRGANRSHLHREQSAEYAGISYLRFWPDWRKVRKVYRREVKREELETERAVRGRLERVDWRGAGFLQR